LFGFPRKPVTKKTIFFALCYELAMEAVKRWPRLRFAPWFPLLLSHCLPFWTEWKTSLTLQKVDEQAKKLVEQWEKEEREAIANKLATKAQELFPQATITPLPDAIVPSVMIVHEAPAEASDAVKALGGELRITWTLDGLK
jgi:hypothetical protein